MCRAKTRMAVLCCCLVALAIPQHSRCEEKQGSPRSVSSSSPPSVPEYPQREIERAKQMLERGSTDQAIALLRKILRENPDNADAHLLLGTALALVPELSQALQELRRAVELRPTFAPAYYTLGTALARFTDLVGAKVMFEKAIELDPRFAEAHSSLALVLAQRKEFAAAREHLVQAIDMQGSSPAAANTHYLLAKVLVEENKPESALRELEVAIRLNPGHAEAHLSQGLIRKQLRDDQGALQSFKRAVELAPGNPVAEHELGVVLLRSGKPSQAVEHLRKASKLNPDDRSYLYHLCRGLQRAGQIEETTECEHRLSAMVKTRLAADSDLTAGKLNNEGVELEKSGKVEIALEKYRSAVELDPFSTVFRRNLALALCRLGHWEEAIAELEDVIKADPEDVKAARALYIALESARATKKTGSASGKAQPDQK